MTNDEACELRMFGEIRAEILKANINRDNDRIEELLHVLDHFNSAIIKDLKISLFIEMGYQTTFLSGLFNHRANEPHYTQQTGIAVSCGSNYEK